MKTFLDIKLTFKPALDAYAKGVRALATSNGKRLYSDEQHAERMAALKAELRAALAEAEGEIDALAGEARAVVRQTASPDLSAHLDLLALEKANHRATFVRDAASYLPLADMATRAEAALSDGDKAGVFLWHLYSAQRLAAVDAQMRAQPDGARRLSDEDSAALRALGDLLPRMAASLTPKDVVRRRADAEAIVSGAVAAKLSLRQQAALVDGTDDAARQAQGEFTRSKF